MTHEPETGPVVKVARDLREILRLHGELEAQAIADGGNPDLPGGESMVALGPVANLEAWEHLVQATERYGRAYTSVADEDPDEAWSAYQTLRFWSEAWRREREHDYEMRQDITTEAAYLRRSLAWAWDNEAGWDDFAADVRRARVKLENILSEGERAERGAPCLYDDCRGVRLVRKLVPKRDGDGQKIWEHSDWHCPRCKRSWDEERYAAMLVAGEEAAKREEVEGETWCSVDYAARQVDRPPATIRVWLHRGHLTELCIIAGRRRFVRLADVLGRDASAPRRKVAS